MGHVEIEKTYLHSDPIGPELQIPLPSDLATPTQALFWVAQMRVENLFRQRELAALGQDAPDILERLEQARVRGGDGRAVLDR